jgi:PAP2 superfamily
VLPQGWLDALRQLLLFAGAYYAYRIVRGIVDGNLTAAFAHSRSLVGFERGLHLFFEPGLQQWALDHRWIIDVADYAYVNSHFMITTAFLVWLYFARNESFYFVRNMFMIAMGIALVGYVVFPAAPPRMLPEWGFADTVADWMGPAASNTASLLYNPYAAVPSMHVAFALMIGIPAAKLVRHRVVKLVWAIYPLFITFVVIVTANHFWIDGAFGTAVAAVSAYTALALARARPEAWAWRTAFGAKAAA